MTAASAQRRSVESVFDLCLTLAVQALEARADHFDHVLASALQSVDHRAQGVRTTVQRPRAQSFGRSVCVLFCEKVAAQFDRLLFEGARRQNSPSAPAAVSLLSFEETDHQAKKSSLASSIAAFNEADLKLLNRNFAALLGWQEMEEARSPFAPGVFLDAVGDALDQRGFDAPLTNMLLRALAAEASLPLRLIYQAINSYFREEPPLNLPRRSAERPASQATELPAHQAQQGRQAPIDAGAAAAFWPAVYAPFIAARPAAESPIVTQLVELLAAGWAGAAQAVTLVDSRTIASTNLLLGEVNRPAMPLAGEHAELHHQLAGSLAGLAALGETEAHGPEFTEELRLFNQWRAGIREQLAELPRRVAFDLVTSLFDEVCRCELVPVALRQQLLGVQTSVLATAISHPSGYFLSHRTLLHAIEALATSSVGTVQPNAQLAEAWQDALTALAQFVSEPASHRRLLQERLRLAEDLAAGDDFKDTLPVAGAARQAMAWMRRVAPRASKDTFLRDFLLWTWSRVLARALNSSKLSATATPRLLKAAPRVAWSVQTAQTDAQRARMRRVMPELLNTLKEGMHLIKLESAREIDFLARLVAAHRRALGLDAGPPPVDRSSSLLVSAADPCEGQRFVLRSTTGPQHLVVEQPGHPDQPTLFLNEHSRRPVLLSSESIDALLREGTLRPSSMPDAPAPDRPDPAARSADA